jgi:hypothetical protein
VSSPLREVSRIAARNAPHFVAVAVLLAAVWCLVPAAGALPVPHAARGSAHAEPLVCTILTPCPPPPANPTPPAPAQPVSQPPTADAGARYDGFRVPGWRAEFTVSRNGSSVREYAIGFTEGHCSNGMRFTSGNVARIADGIAHDGQASGSRHFARAYILSPSGKRIDGHETMSFNLQFAGDRLDGSFHDLFIASHLRCSSGWVPFTAYRDGTPQAPLIGKLVDTGVYRTTAHIGFGDPMTMHVYLPQQDVASMTVTWFLDCHIGNP